MTVFLDIDYDEDITEDDPVIDGNYRGVVVSGSGEPTRFFTGDPGKDMADARVFGSELAAKSKERFVELSSTTHFVFDVPGWRYDSDDNLVRDPNA